MSVFDFNTYKTGFSFFVIHKDIGSLFGYSLEIYSFKENIMRNSKLPGS